MRTLKIIKSGISTVWQGVRSKFTPAKNNVVVQTKDLQLQKDEFVKTNAKPPRPLKNSDIFNFRQYVHSKKVDLKVTPQEIKELFAYEGEEFRTKSFEFLCKKMNVPKEIQPKFIYSTDLNVSMNYNYASNSVNINPNFKEVLENKTLFLATLRHEMQHYNQYMSIFRHEEKGTEFVKQISKLNAEFGCKNIDNYVRNFNEEQLRQTFNEQEFQEMMVLKYMLKNNLTAQYNSYMEQLEKMLINVHLPNYMKFRQTVVDKLGILKKDSQEGIRVEKMFKENASRSYWGEDGNINMSEYITNMLEIEAMTAQDMMTLRINAAINGNDKYCYLKLLRESQEQIKKHAKELDPQLRELVNEPKQIEKEDLKQYLSYIFD